MIQIAARDYLRLFGISNVRKELKNSICMFSGTICLIALNIGRFGLKDTVLTFSVLFPVFLMIFSNISNYCFLDKMIYYCPFSKKERIKISFSKYRFKIILEMTIAIIFASIDLILFKDINPIGFIMVITADFSVSSCLWVKFKSSDERNESYKIASSFAGVFSIIISFFQLAVISGAKGNRVVFYICIPVYVLLIVPCTVFGIKGSIRMLKERAVSYIEFNKETGINKSERRSIW